MTTNAITNGAANQTVRVTPWGNLQVANEALAIFSEPFDGVVLDTVDRWNTPVAAGTGALAVGAGLATFTVGTGGGSAVALSSIEKFAGLGASFLQYATLVQFEAGVGGLLPLNVNAFYGQGTPNASFTAATPLTDAIGLERTIDGRISAVMYSNTTRILIKDLTNLFLDGAPHLFGVAVRGDTKYFFVNELEVPVASITYFGPSFVNLPMRAHLINHTTGPAAGPTFKLTGVQVVDSGRNYPIVFNGATIFRARTPSVFKQINAVSIAAEVAVWTPAAGKKFRLMGFVLTSGTVGGNVLLKDGTAGATIMVVPFGAAAQTINSPALGNGVLSAVINNPLTATGAATQLLSGFLFGTEE